MAVDRIDSIVSLAKRRGFVYPSSEIYGGSRSAWDYGPLGVELKDNVRRQWWKAMGQQRDAIVGLDSAGGVARGGGGRRWSSPATTSSPSTGGWCGRVTCGSPPATSMPSSPR